MKNMKSDKPKELSSEACTAPTSFPSILAIDYSLVWWEPQPQKIVTTLPIVYSSSCSLLLPLSE